MGAVLIHNGKDAAQIVREGKISFHHAVFLNDDGVAVKVIELAWFAIFCNLFVFPGIDCCPDIRTFVRQLRISSFLIRAIDKVLLRLLPASSIS
ncbi:hypothetical protein PBR_0894 [Segatella baroniae B14]|uniref:Uncharacterized protein n=1 Tax=Segatella baroniae B14 TaxID=752555 RepID=D8DW33_9BACT|nr:hypothetical protein PBR_0894 [Segatella baroniae B14]